MSISNAAYYGLVAVAWDTADPEDWHDLYVFDVDEPIHERDS